VSPETVPLQQHLAALRAADKALAKERDRRYAEVAEEREKALKIKESADEKALDLASQIQTYKDQQHNGLLQQLDRQAATFVARAEWDTAHTDLVNRIISVADRLSALELRLTSRLERGDGADAGTAVSRTERRLDTGQLLLLLGVIIAAAAVVVAVLKG
jgi:hypothetical protein